VYMLLFSAPDQSIVRAAIVAPSVDFTVMPVQANAAGDSKNMAAAVVSIVLRVFM